MRRPIVIIIGFIILVFAIVIVLFGLKSPEMPIQEVHKVIPMTKFQQQATTPPLPALPTPSVPINNATSQQAVSVPAMPQPGTVPGGASNPPSSPSNATATPPVTTQSGVMPNNAVQPQSGVPLIIPQQQNTATGKSAAGQAVVPPTAQQAIPAMPQAGAVPGNAVGNTQQQ